MVKKPYRLSILLTCALVGLFLAFGCETDHVALPPPEVEAARQHADTLIREARAETTAMRSEFASVRIAAAKKDGDLQELRREITALREAADRKQRELEALRTERDNLLQVKNEFHVQLAELPDLRLKVAHASSNEAVYQARLQDIESALAHLTRDIYGLTAPRQTALEETAGGALQTRIKELESGMAMFLAEWEHFKTDWAQTKIQSKPAVLEPAKKEPEQAAPSKPRKAKTSGP